MLKWDDFTMLQTSRLFIVVPGVTQHIGKVIHCPKDTILGYSSSSHWKRSPSNLTFPRWRTAASSLKISQESFSENIRIFRAEQRWEYSIRSSRPSQLVHLPWWRRRLVKKRHLCKCYDSDSKNKETFARYHGQIVVVRSSSEGKSLLLLSRHPLQHVVKDVIVSFLGRLNTHIS